MSTMQKEMDRMTDKVNDLVASQEREWNAAKVRIPFICIPLRPRAAMFSLYLGGGPERCPSEGCGSH